MKRFALFTSAAIVLAACGGHLNDEVKIDVTDSIADSTSNLSGLSTDTIIGKEISYSVDSTTMKGYLSYDSRKQGKRPGILIVHEWWGHNAYVRKRADMLAELGYVAFALDMYGNGKQAEHPDDAKKFSGMVMENMDLAETRFNAAYKLLAGNPNVNPTDISAIGYCFGGSLVLAMAYEGLPLDGVAAFHSGVEVPVKPNKNLKARILVQNGADDPFVSKESVDRFKKQMDELKAPYQYVSFPGAMHAYSNPEATKLGKEFKLPLAYNKNADTTSWSNLKEFLTTLYPSKERDM